MPNTRDIRNRIKGVKSTRQITRAMQMVATSKTVSYTHLRAHET